MSMLRGTCWRLPLQLLLLTACSGAHLDFDKHGRIDAPVDYQLSDIVVRVEPNGRPVDVSWKGFNIRHQDLGEVRWEELELSGGGEVYRITDKRLGNNALIVNQQLYEFDGRTQCVLISIGAGPSITALGPGHKAIDIGEVFE